jgi:hypothetical protein
MPQDASNERLNPGAQPRLRNRMSRSQSKMSRSQSKPREPLETLKTYPGFQALRAKAETHQLQFRPKESERMKQNNSLDEILDSRAESAWNSLKDNLANGANLNEAEEIALQNILVLSEKEEDEGRLDREEQSSLDLPR